MLREAERSILEKQADLEHLLRKRAILAARGRTPVDDETLDELVQFDETIATFRLRQQAYLAALQSYQRTTVRRGLVLAAVVIGLMVVALAGRAVRAFAL